MLDWLPYKNQNCSHMLLPIAGRTGTENVTIDCRIGMMNNVQKKNEKCLLQWKPISAKHGFWNYKPICFGAKTFHSHKLWAAATIL